MLLTKLKRPRVVVLPLPVEDRLLPLLLVAVSGLGVRDTLGIIMAPCAVTA